MIPSEPLFRGVAAALVTLFDDDTLAVDVAATTAHAERLVDLGIRAVLVAGTTGEAPALTPDERTSLVTALRAALPSGVPVIAGTGAPDGRAAAALTVQARDAGADAALVLSPYLAADPRAYFDTIAKAAPDIPLVAYHYPAVCPPGIPLEALADLPVVAMKDSSADPGRLLAELDRWDRPVYPGSALLVSMAAGLGCPGAILALANGDPEGCIAAWNDGTGDGAAQLGLIGPHLDVVGAGFPQGIKAVTARRFPGTSTAARMG